MGARLLLLAVIYRVFATGSTTFHEISYYCCRTPADRFLQHRSREDGPVAGFSSRDFPLRWSGAVQGWTLVQSADPVYGTARRLLTGPQAHPGASSKEKRANMSETRFPPLSHDQMTDEQRAVVDAIQSGPRGAGLRGPFNALVRSPTLCDLVQRVGAYVRFGSSIPAALNELAICMAGRKWGAQYEFYAHRRLGIDAGLSPAILDAIAVGRRPADMSSDETVVYEFVTDLLSTGAVTDPRYRAALDRFGERGVMDLVGAVGYYSLVSMVLNVAQVPLPEGETAPLKPL
jgi:4-carboxymuconolactone decarboxylase